MFSVFISHKIPGYLQGQKDHFPDYSVDQTLQEYKTGEKLSQYNNEMLYILTFQVLSVFSAKFRILSRFSHLLG